VTIIVLSRRNNGTLVVEANNNVNLSSIRVVRVGLKFRNGDFRSSWTNTVKLKVLEGTVGQFLGGGKDLTAGSVNVRIVTMTHTTITDETKVDVLVALTLKSGLDGLGNRGDVVSNISLAEVDILLNDEDDIGVLTDLFGPGLVQTMTLTTDIIDTIIWWVDR